ncbi:hypothetical protein GGX14DRAFT_699010, partial [Mycena pura]
PPTTFAPTCRACPLPLPSRRRTTRRALTAVCTRSGNVAAATTCQARTPSPLALRLDVTGCRAPHAFALAGPWAAPARTGSAAAATTARARRTRAACLRAAGGVCHPGDKKVHNDGDIVRPTFTCCSPHRTPHARCSARRTYAAPSTRRAAHRYAPHTRPLSPAVHAA